MAGIGDEEPIRVLEDAVRRRPGMYVGNLGDGSGLHRMIQQLVELAADHARAGRCREVRIVLRRDGGVSVHHDGRGNGFEQDRNRYMLVPTGSGALAIAEALSERFRRHVVRDGQRRSFDTPSGDDGPIATGPTPDPDGVTIELAPDPRVFQPAELSRIYFADVLRAQAHLSPGLTAFLVDERETPAREIVTRGDLRAWIAQLARDRPRVHAEPIVVEGGDDEATFALAMLWVADTGLELHGFVNGRPTPRGGVHVDALLRALGAATTGLVAVLSVRLPDPQFDSQTTDRLSGPQGSFPALFDDAVREVFGLYPELRAAAGPSPVLPPLEAVLADAPDDAATALVYADALLATGDPRGELIALEHALRIEADPAARDALDRRAAVLLDDDRARIWDRPGGFPFRRRWRGRSCFFLNRVVELPDPEVRIRRFLDAVTDSLGPHRVDAPTRHHDALVALGFEHVPGTVPRGRRWARRAPPGHAIHDDIAALGAVGVALHYSFRLTDRARVPLPCQRAGWYAHGLGLASELHAELETGRVGVRLSLPFDRFDDERFVRVRGSIHALVGAVITREDCQQLVPGPYGDGMARG